MDLDRSGGGESSRVYRGPSLGWVQEPSSFFVTVIDFGAACDGVTDDAAAINAALSVPNTRVVIPAGVACRVASTITIQAGIGTTLCGMDFDAGAYPSPTSSRIIADAGVSPVVQFKDGGNRSTTIENLAIGRAGGVPVSSTIGLLIQDNYNIVLRNILSYNHGICYKFAAQQVLGNSAGLGLNAIGLYGYQAVDAYIVNDSWPEMRISHSRFGHNASGDYTPNCFMRFRGGVPATAGGPNTVHVLGCQFNQIAKVLHWLEFVNLNGGVTDNTEFVFDGCHIEGIQVDGSGGACIYSDSSWVALDDLKITNCTFNDSGTKLFALDPATQPKKFLFNNNTVYGTNIVLAPTGTSMLGVNIANNWLQVGAMTLTGAAGGYCNIIGNHLYNTTYTVSGTWSRFTSIGNDQVGGSRSITAAANNSLILDHGWNSQLSGGNLSNTGGFFSSNGTLGIGYITGAGGTVTQITSRTTGVTLNKITGNITMFSAAGSATPASFSVGNSSVAATDVIILNVQSGAVNTYNFLVSAVAAGSFFITFWTTGGVAVDAPVINFAVIKGVTA